MQAVRPQFHQPNWNCRPKAARRASPKLPDGSALAFAVRLYEAAVRQLRQPATTGHRNVSPRRPAGLTQTEDANARGYTDEVRTLPATWWWKGVAAGAGDQILRAVKG